MFPHLPKTTEWLRRSNRFRRALYGNAQVRNNHAWAVATLMGHSTPKVSFASYCHTFDILLPEFLRDSRGLESVLSARDRLRLSSFRRRSTSYDHLPGEQKLSDNGASDAALDEPLGANVAPTAASKSNKCRIEGRNLALGEVRFRFPNLQSERMQRPPACHRSWLEQTWGLLYMRTQPNLDFEKLAEFLGVEIKLAQRILTRNDEICWLRSVTAGQDLHATITIPEERNGIKTVRYPRRPDSKAMKTAHQLVDRIAQFVNKDNGKAARILEYWSRNVVPESGSVVFTMFTRRRQTVARIGEKGIREGILPVSALVGSAARRALFCRSLWHKRRSRSNFLVRPMGTDAAGQLQDHQSVRQKGGTGCARRVAIDRTSTSMPPP
jgi:hypothetical protein